MTAPGPLGDLSAYVGRTAGLFDRLHGPFEPAGQAKDWGRRLKRWKEAVDPGGCPGALAIRLKHLGLSEERLPSILGEVTLTRGAPQPQWLDDLLEILESCGPGSNIDQFIASAASVGTRALHSIEDKAGVILQPEVQASLKSSFEKLIRNIAGEVIEYERRTRRAAASTALTRLLGQENSYIRLPATPILRRYPVAAKLMMSTSSQLVTCVKESLLRLSADFAELRLAFDLRCESPIVSKLDLDMSDPHEHGRTVLVFELQAKEKVVYKPKPLQAETWFKDVLAQNPYTAGALASYPRHLTRDEYGWSSWVPEEEADTPFEKSRGLELAGATLFALYRARATDVHFQNVRSVRGLPVILDCETLLHPDPRDTLLSLPIHLASQAAYWDSVLRTMFLPQWMVDSAKQPVSVGGTGRFLEFSSDDKASVACYLSGFREAYAHALAKPDALPRLPEGLSLRYILRPTHLYGDLLKHSLSPAFLQNAIDRSLELEVLGRLYMPAEETRRAPPLTLLDTEIKALERLDVPRFVWRPGKPHLFECGQIVCHDFLTGDRPGAAPLTAEDLENQSQIIEMNMTAYHGHGERQLRSCLSAEGESLDWDTWLAKIEADALRSAVRRGDGEIAWLSPQTVRGTDRYQFGPLDASLYDGIAGLALYLAWSGKILSSSSAMRTACDTLRPVAEFCRREPTRAVKVFGCGGMHGVGGLLYAFRHLSAITAQSLFFDASTKLIAVLRERQWPLETSADMVFGSGGLLSVLLGEDTDMAQDAAANCAAHIQLRAERTPGGHLAWRDASDRFQTGFSHGSSGIAYALARWIAVSGSDAFQRLVAAAWDFEDSAFDAANAKWKKYGDEDTDAYGYAWCHGVPGMLMGRLTHGAGAWADRLLMGRPGIELLVPATALTLHQVCCGHMGRALIAEDLARALPHLSAALRRVRNEELNAFEGTEGSFLLLPGVPAMALHLGLMQGTSGIALGRLALFDMRIPAFWRLA